MQVSLFALDPPRFDVSFTGATRRQLLENTWIEHAPGWLTGHQTLFEQLLVAADWRHQRRQMYEREVDVPRLVAGAPRAGAPASLLRQLSGVLSQRYGRVLDSVSLAYYRNGQDSVAPHGDKMGALRADTVIAIVSVGEPRRFVLRSLDGSVRLALALGWGDLLVMGGGCQRTCVHGVPKVKRAGPRMSIQFRQTLPPASAKTLSADITVSRPVKLSGERV